MRLLLALGLWFSLASPAIAQGLAPLVKDGTIALPDTRGRIDHLAIDLARKHLIVAELGNGTVDVIDLDSRKVIHRIDGLEEPQGVVYAPKSDLIAIAFMEWAVR